MVILREGERDGVRVHFDLNVPVHETGSGRVRQRGPGGVGDMAYQYFKFKGLEKSLLVKKNLEVSNFPSPITLEMTHAFQCDFYNTQRLFPILHSIIKA